MSATRELAQDGLGLRYWGVRGTVGVAGTGFNAFGGHTSCIEILAGTNNNIIIDAGTGIVPLGIGLKAKAGDHFDILLTHLHHDHVIGLLLFAPCFMKGVTINVYCGNLGGESAEEALRKLFSPPLFPVTFDALPSKIRFIGFSAGETIKVGGMKIRTCPLNHPDGATGYRFERGGRSLAVLTDMEHEGDASDPAAFLVDFCRGADLIVFDATWDEDEYSRFRGWGHSTWEAGAALAKAAKVKLLSCFHHAPHYDDARLTRMEKNLQTDFPGGSFARESECLFFEPALKSGQIADRVNSSR